MSPCFHQNKTKKKCGTEISAQNFSTIRFAEVSMYNGTVQSYSVQILLQNLYLGFIKNYCIPGSLWYRSFFLWNMLLVYFVKSTPDIAFIKFEILFELTKLKKTSPSVFFDLCIYIISGTFKGSKNKQFQLANVPLIQIFIKKK